MHILTSNVTGCHRGPKQKLRAGYNAYYMTLYYVSAVILQHSFICRLFTTKVEMQCNENKRRQKRQTDYSLHNE